MQWRRRLAALMAAILTVAVLAGCGTTPAPAPTGTPKPTGTSAPQPAAKPITLKWANWVPPNAPFAMALDTYLTMVEKRSEGRIKFDRYWAESLIPAAQQLDGLSAGIMDLTVIWAPYYPSKVPLDTVCTFGMFLTDQGWVAMMAKADLYEQVPAMREELAKYKARFLAPQGGSPYYLLSRRPVKTLADLKGMKIRVAGEGAVVMKEFGALPVSTTAPEIYSALEKGTIDAVFFAPGSVITYGLQEVAKYYWLLPSGSTVCTIGIGEESWKKVPEDLQKLMLAVAKDYPAEAHKVWEAEGITRAIATMKAAGVTFSSPTKEELDKNASVVETVLVKQWKADMTAKGLPGETVYNTFAQAIKKYEPLSPFKK